VNNDSTRPRVIPTREASLPIHCKNHYKNHLRICRSLVLVATIATLSLPWGSSTSRSGSFLSTFIPAAAAQTGLDPDAQLAFLKGQKGAVAQIGHAIGGYSVTEPEVPRGGTNLYNSRVLMVPAVMSTGLGAGIVIGMKGGHALVITNYHVVEHPLVDDVDEPFVVVLFFDKALKDENFEEERLEKCLLSSSASDWCTAVRRSMRIGRIVAGDSDRDLALLAIDNPPSGLAPIALASKLPQEGDDVAVIGHPEGLLWSYATGIVSAVRRSYPLGKGFGTVIQTQTPINPGNSGGPMLTTDGALAGVIFAGRALGTIPLGSGEEKMTIPASGLGLAIGLNEVSTFIQANQK
jgi:S1-C subfamily serine protease